MAILAELDQTFGGYPKPEEFTDRSHCDECTEHDNTLQKGRDRITRTDLGNPGWDPVGFCRKEGLFYLFPTLARYAFVPDLWRDREWYGAQILDHLDNGSILYRESSAAEKRLMARFLGVLETVAKDFNDPQSTLAQTNALRDLWAGR
ncbi:MAG: hypothetical protein AAF458_03200 [Pseudomonadota bacterium]